MKEKVLNRMRHLCSRREYCSADILKKACDALDGDRNGAQEIVDILISEKYVDDLRYATAYARDKATISGWGETKIRYMLSGKGIPRETISCALMEVDEGRAGMRLEKLIAAKAKSLKDDPQVRLKLLRFGLGRGYRYDEVAQIIDSLILRKL